MTIWKCIGDVVPTVTIKTYTNQKPCIDRDIHAKLKAQTITFNHGKVTGNMGEYKQCSYSLCKVIKHKQEKHQYRDKVESQFNGSDMRRMWQDLQIINDYKGKIGHVAYTVLLPDKLNTFVRFEDNTVPLTQPATKDCGPPSPC